MGFDSSFYSPSEPEKRKAFREASFNDFYSFDTQSFGRLIPVLDSIFDEYSSRKIMYKENIKSLLDLFFIELYRQTKKSIGKNCSQVINERIILEVKRRLMATSNQGNTIFGCQN